MVKQRKNYLHILRNMGIEVHGYTEETCNEEISKNKDHFRSLIKKT
jgi:hypothetical protein